jgi:hypothetical protein
MAASKSSSATALLLAALLLFAATIALAQTPPEPEDEKPGCLHQDNVCLEKLIAGCVRVSAAGDLDLSNCYDNIFLKP